MIHYDRTPNTTVVWCDCGWRDLCLTQEHSWFIAEYHERSVHPEQRQVRKAADKRSERTTSYDDRGER